MVELGKNSNSYQTEIITTEKEKRLVIQVYID